MFAGIDLGSVTIKGVLIDDKGKIITFSIISTDYGRQKNADELLDLLLNKQRMTERPINYIVSTGYGRRSFSRANRVIPEIVCHAKGTKHLIHNVRTIIDIGGQDSKIIQLDDDGNIIHFGMNDKCAAGTGRFLEVLTERILNLPISEIGPLSIKSVHPCILSSVCTVFAETEIISLLSENEAKEDILQGMNIAIAKRVISIGKSAQITFEEPIVFSGGVAKNTGIVKAFEELLGKKVIVPNEPQITGALGAAVFAVSYYKKENGVDSTLSD
jgi:predicted CoA-substrate-specific enzyme activase